MKNKLKLVACSLFLSVGTLTALVVLDNDNDLNIFNPSTVKAGAPYYLTLNSSNKYVDGDQDISTDLNNGAVVRFAYTNASSSSQGHVVLGDGGTLKNTNQLTSLSSFIPSFTLGNGASLKFRASNDGVEWGEYVSIKPYGEGITSSSFNLPYMRFVEFKAEGDSVDIGSISFCYTCSESDNQGQDNYEIGTSYVDSNISYTTNDTYNSLSGGLVVYKNYNGGAQDALDSSAYDVSVKNPSGAEINKASNLVAGEHTVTISRKDKAFADISYNFTVVTDRFAVTTDTTTPQKIHTTDQENFLNYSGDYYNITSSELNSYNAIGTAENSFPNQVSLAWNYDAPSGKTLKNFEIVTGQEPNLGDGYKITGTTTPSISFYNPFLGVNYFKIIANFTDNTSDESPIKTFMVDSTAPRNLKIDTMSNCRDMGGRTTYAGGMIRQGMIYRTAQTADSGSNASSAIKEEMLNRFKIKSEIFVKDGNDSSSPLGNSVQFYNCSMDYGATPYSNLTRNAERLRKVFSVLGDINNYPLFYHCRIGTDRTGICGVAINGLLGVPFNEVIQDYAFSNFGKIDGQRYPHKTPDNNGDDAAKYIDEILAMPGKNFQEQVYYSLLSIGIPEQTLRNVIDIMTIGNKATLPTDIAIANGNNLTNNGGTRKTSSDYKNPDVYYEISGASKSVSTSYTITEASNIKVICYLGSTNSSDSTKLASGINLKIDGVSQTIVDKTYYKAGFGSTKQASRTGYMFNLLGAYNLSAGEHIITIAGKNSDKFNIGGIILVGTEGVIGPDESGGGNQNPVETTVASWLSTDEIAKNNVTVITNNEGTYYKLKDDTSYVEYTFNSMIAGTATLKALVGTVASNATSSRKLWYDGTSVKFTFTVNGNNVAITDDSTTFAGAGMTTTELSPNGGGNSNAPVWVDFPEMTIINGQNTIRIARTAGYTLYFYEFIVVAYI